MAKSELVAERGYLKGTLTRLYNSIQGLKTESCNSLQSRMTHLKNAFQNYEVINKAIFLMDPEDSEDIMAVENKYYATEAAIKDAIDDLTTRGGASAENETPLSSPGAKIVLPTINVEPFDGRTSAKYVTFINMFTSLVDKDTKLDQVQKLHYLRSFLRDEAYNVIKNLPITNSSYLEALTLLRDRYYNKFNIVSEYVASLLDLPNLGKSNNDMRNFISTIKQSLAALKNLDIAVDSWNPILIVILTRKIDTQTARAFQLERKLREEPTVTELLEFMEKRAIAIDNVEVINPQPHLRHAVHVTTSNSQGTGISCLYCKSSRHKLFSCKQFQLMPVSVRIKFVTDSKLCKICLNKHNGKCKFHFRCTQCKQAHNSLIHSEQSEPVSLLSNTINNVLLPTARIKVFTRDNKEVHIKAILDSGSQASLVTSKVVNVLGMTPSLSNSSIIGIGNIENKSKYSIPLEIHSLTSNFRTFINFNVVDTITCKMPQSQINLASLNIPPGLLLADDSFHSPSEINMLLAADVFFQIILPKSKDLVAMESERPQSSLSSHKYKVSKPAILNTKLGHIIGGTLPADSENKVRISLHCHTCESTIPDINEQLKNFWATEKVPEVMIEKSNESELAEQNFNNTVILKDSKFQVDLPLKIELNKVNDTLGNSFELALFRFLHLEKKLHKNKDLLSKYQNFIEEYISMGHAHYFDISGYDFSKDPIYFIPHHAVLNEASKTTPLRVVFDGSMLTSKKVSINNLLHNGPKVQRDLFDILLLFRHGEFIFTTDIKKMFRNIRLNPMHTSLQNILWRGNPGEPIRCIRLDTITYGLKSSSYLATRCLIELANRYETKWPLASFVLKNCTYVDDVLYSHSNLPTLLETKRQLIEILKMGGFETHKWSSNNEEVQSTISEPQLVLNDYEFGQENTYNIKTLGLTYNLQKDCFIISSPDTKDISMITKSSILSCVSRFYDPLGFVSPIIVKAKVIMQKLWFENIGWNDKPSDKLTTEWLQFSENLAKMKPIYLDRHIPVVEKSSVVQLIGFADASATAGYGCCLYLRITTNQGITTNYLLCSKSRINPKSKPLTIPRLELNACLLLAKITKSVYDILKLKFNISEVILFSDSQIVLAWIATEAIKLLPYVSNRVKVIQEFTRNWAWLYVQSQDNPADLISRGVYAEDLANCSLWWHGPNFLLDSKYDYNIHHPVAPDNLPELKATANEEETHISVLFASTGNDLLKSFIIKYSSINTAIRVLALCRRYRDNLRMKLQDRNAKINTGFLKSCELQEALLVLIKYDQYTNYKSEIQAITLGKQLTGSLKQLHPFLDCKNILRVGGRLQASNISYGQKHPIILVKGSKLTQLIIINEHIRQLHAGPKLLLSSLNQSYWLINGIREIKKCTYKCITCFRLKANASKQLMGSLPSSRVRKSVRAFQKTGIDFAGPIKVKNSRIRSSLVGNGYICVFVCFSTKAVHLELASDLSTATFLACFRRFISRRGLPSDCYCDNASTFRCASSQLTELYKLFNSKAHQLKVNNFAVLNQINFHFIPAYSPVFGGLWEAAVKVTKNYLKKNIQKVLLTYEELNTVLTQIEAVLNSRPLIPITSNCDDFSYLTPGHFLVGTALTAYPEHDVSEIPTNKLRMWNICNNIVQSFWKVWYKQYLNVLQCRPKWQVAQCNIKVGTLVLLVEQNTPPMTWPMARVTQVFPGKDNKVRAFEVMTPNRRTHIRSITKVCVLPVN